MRDQLRNFHSQLKRNSTRINKHQIPRDWFTAFELLESYLDGLKKPGKKVVFIDEFPWLATARSKFLTAFEHFWNTYCTKRNDLVVVICGSAASDELIQTVQEAESEYAKQKTTKIKDPNNIGESIL